MKRLFTLFISTILFFALHASAQDAYVDKVKAYVEKYKGYAIAEQIRAGIPAAVTLGQGVLETQAGTSELMLNANNHFGVKCKNDWKGATYTYTDDAPDECFKKYNDAAESYKDHSDHLKKNQRYAPLFKISLTDYAAWSIGLKKCGYATNKQYAQQLIKIIEDFKLQDYTYEALNSNGMDIYPVDTTMDDAPAIAMKKDSTDYKAIKTMADDAKTKVMQDVAVTQALPVPAENPVSQKADGKIEDVNGLKAFKAHKGEMLLQYAVKYNIRYNKLLEMNDLQDAPLPADMYVYIEKKATKGLQDTHTVKEGETLLIIAQEEGIQLKKLMAYNQLKASEEPEVGTVLQLQELSAHKPTTRNVTVATAVPDTHSEETVKPDYVETTKPVSKATDIVAVDTNVSLVETPKSMPPVVTEAHVAITPTTQQKEEPAADTVQDDLARLKAQLDKVVYPDDKHVAASERKSNVEPVAPKAKETKEATKAKPAENNDADKYYVVKKGDTAFSIAKRNNITIKQLNGWNGLDFDAIKVGQKLRVKE